MSGRTGDGVDQDCRPSNEMDKPTTGTGRFKVHKDGGSIEEAEETEAGEGNSRRWLDDRRATGEKAVSLSTNQTSRMENAMNPDGNPKNGAEALEKLDVLSEKEDGVRMKQANCLNVSCVEHLESMAENDMPTPVGPAHKTSALEQDETNVDKAGPPRHPLVDSGTHIYSTNGKGKERAISDGSLDGRTLKDDCDDEESFASVESCNTSAWHSRGKKRSNFEQQLIEGTKRVKTQTQESPESTSRLQQDSSFVNWISNMIKGLWKVNEENRSPPPALGVDGVPVQDLGKSCQREDNRSRNTGFQSIFKSMYCPKRRNEEADTELLNEAYDAGTTRLSCLQKASDFPEKFLIKNENDMYTFDNEVGLEAKPIVSSGKLASSEANKAISFKGQHPCSDERYMDKKVKGSFSSLGKSKPNKNTGAEADGKATQSFASRNDGLGSLWITRFSSRSFCQQNKDGDRCSSEAVECTNDWKKRISSVDPKDSNESASTMVKTFNFHKVTIDNNVPEGFGTINCYDDSIMIHDLNAIASSPRRKSLEAMACRFARRLDAIKHIAPSDLFENPAGSIIFTCFHCGKKGHRLWDCSEVTDTVVKRDIECLMRNITAQNGANAASSLCIRCFQLKLRAAECANAPRQRPRAEGNKIKNSNRTTDVVKKFTEANPARRHAPASASREKLPSFCDSINKQVTDAPEGIFDAVRVLRLSRTNILKWMTSNSKDALSHLEGFFLRLRLGKWEKGLGGTGYHVACINGGSDAQSSPRNSKNSISVTVGGMTCLVESQYISNHDFLEEELKAWWSAIARSAGGLPSEEELRQKMRQRKMLGF